MIMRQIIYLFLIVFIATSCGKEEKITPDFSTPEAGWKTAFYADGAIDIELILETSSREILATYGDTREEQTETIKKDSRDLKKDRKSRLEVIRTEYIDENHANVFYNHFVGSKLWAPNMRVLMVKEDGKWKVALDEKPFTS